MIALRYATRQLRNRPGVPVLIIALLAVSIGITTAIFSLFHKVLMEDLPVPEPDQLVNLRAPGPKWGSVSDDETGDSSYVFSYPMFRDLQTLRGSFSGIAAHRSFAANVSTGQRTLATQGQLVSGNYFQVLALRPALGRLIAPYDEPGLGESRVVVLSYEYWQSQFGGDPEVLDRTIIVNGEPLSIIGVAPKGFTGTTLGLRPDVFVPLTLRWLMQRGAVHAAEDRRAYWLYLFGRLTAGARLESASLEINRLYSAILNEIEAPLNGSMPPDILQQFRERRVELEPGALGQSTLRVFLEQPLALLLALTGLVLTIVCVNAGSLLLARASSRRGELAIRASLGATRWRLVSNMLSEAALLALAGMTLSLPVAWATLEFLVRVLPTGLAGGLTTQLDSTHVAFAAITAISTLALFGVAPVMYASQSNLAGTLKGQSRATDAISLARFRRALSTAQIAFSLTLLVLAGLFLQSFRNISRIDLGISVDSVVTFTVAPRVNGYSEERTRAIYADIEGHLSRIPGIDAVGSSSVRLLANDSAWNSLSVEGFADGPGVNTNAATNWVNPDFFQALSIPLLQGRGFTRADTKATAKIAVVNESFVRKFGLEERAIGARFGIGDTTNLDIEIVGVVADSRYGRIKGAPPPQYFRPMDQGDGLERMSFYVRASMAPEVIADQIREQLEALAPDLPISDLMTMEAVAQDNVFVDRAIALLSLSFSVLATAVAAIGLYGMLLYNLAQRTRELGLRLALGATAPRLRLMVLKEVGLMVLIGSIIGLVAASIAGRSANSLLYGMPSFDLISAAIAVTILALVALCASYPPIRRASHTTPVEALRYE